MSGGTDDSSMVAERLLPSGRVAWQEFRERTARSRKAKLAGVQASLGSRDLALFNASDKDYNA